MADESRYALLIAVSHYDHKELSALPKTLRDVVDMHDTLVQSYGFAPERVRILWDHPPVTRDAAVFEAEGEPSQLSADHRQLLVQSATEQSIPLAVEEFLSDKVNPDDFRLLYYGGHGLQSGAGEFYLALRQSKPDKAAIGITGSALKTWIKNGSKRQLLILDSCNAAAMMADARGALPQAPVDFLGDEAVDDQQPMAWEDRGEGRFLLAASKKYQAALETLQFKPEWRNSVYTHHLLAGLRNYAAADSELKVTPHSLHSYVMERVPGDTSGKQEPRLQALDGTGVSFALAKKPKLPDDLIAQIDSDSWKYRQAAVARLKADYRNPRCKHQSLVLDALKRLNQDADKRVSIEAHDALERLGLLDGSSAGEVDEQKPWAKIAVGLLLLGLASGVVYEREGLLRWASQVFSPDRATLQKAIANQQWQVAEQLCNESVPLRSSALCTLDYPSAKQQQATDRQLELLSERLANTISVQALQDIRRELQALPAELVAVGQGRALQEKLNKKLAAAQQQSLQAEEARIEREIATATSQAQLTSLQDDVDQLSSKYVSSADLDKLRAKLDNKNAELVKLAQQRALEQALAAVEQKLSTAKNQTEISVVQSRLAELSEQYGSNDQIEAVQTKLVSKRDVLNEKRSAEQLAAKIRELLAQAEARWRAYNYTTPKGAAALHSYRQVLQLQPDNAAALQGIERIVAYYDSRAEGAIEAGNWRRVEQMIEGIQRVGAQRPEIGRLRVQLALAKAIAQPSSPYKAMEVMPAGNFTMGSPENEEGRDDDEQPHKVDIRSFKMGKYAVTNAWYVEFLNDGPHSIPSDEPWFYNQAEDQTSRIIKNGNRYAVEASYEDYPVVNVSWYGAKAFARWLNKDRDSQLYRLPSEAEWEYAARAGTKTAYWWGNSIKVKGEAQANCDSCGSQWDNREPAPVDAFQSNPFRLYNTLGNTWEWVEDCYSSYDSTPRDGQAKTSDCDRADIRVLRGGSWDNKPQRLRSAYRDDSWPNDRNYFVGFRVAQDL